MASTDKKHFRISIRGMLLLTTLLAIGVAVCTQVYSTNKGLVLGYILVYIFLSLLLFTRPILRELRVLRGRWKAFNSEDFLKPGKDFTSDFTSGDSSE